MEERGQDRITVRDPSHPARPADVLVSGEDAPRPSPFTRRRLEALGWMVLGAALALGLTEVRDRWQNRQLDRVLDLVVAAAGTNISYDQRRGEADIVLRVEVRNDGPRNVVVEQGTAGGYVLVRSLVELPSGEQTSLLLRQTVTCSRTAPPPAAAVDDLRLELRTAAGPRSLSLPMDPDRVRDEGARACGFFPLEEAINVEVYAETREGALELAVGVNNRSVQPAVLVALDLGPGLRAQVREGDGGPAVLPLPLPPSRPGNFLGGASVQVRVTVVDCAEARTASPQVELRFTDDDEEFGTSIDYGPAALDSLLSTACPS